VPVPTPVPTEGGAGRNKELMLSISTIPKMRVCQQKGMLGFSNGAGMATDGCPMDKYDKLHY